MKTTVDTLTLAQLNAMPPAEQDKRIRELVYDAVIEAWAEMPHQFSYTWSDLSDYLLLIVWQRDIEDKVREADAILSQDTEPARAWFEFGVPNPRERVICLLMALGRLAP